MKRPFERPNLFHFWAKRGVAFYLVLTFLYPSFSLPGARAETLLSVESFQPFPEPSDFKLPESLGQTQDSYRGESDRHVILIQDAHALPDAQQSISKMIQFLFKKYGISHVFLEGASTPLDPQIFRSYPDQAQLKKTFEVYQRHGELTGGTAAALFADRRIQYEGAEDWELYEEGLRLYRRSLTEESKVKKKLRAFQKVLTGKKKKNYPPELFKADQSLRLFQENKLTLDKTLKIFAAIQPPPKGSEIDLILHEIQNEGKAAPEIEKEVHSAALKLRSFLATSSAAKGELQSLNQRLQEYQTSSLSAGALSLFLQETAGRLGVRLELSESLRAASRHQKRIRDIQGTRFFDELEAYTRAVKETHLNNGIQKELEQQTRKFELLARLARLELGYKEWTAVQAIDLEASWRDLLRGQIDFYKNAQAREEIFFKRLSESKAKTAIFVAGGFHAGGLIERCKARGISYVLVSPQISSVPEDSVYRDHLRGAVSWRDYFKAQDGKVSIYDAFVRSSRDRLTAESADRQFQLKKWRDQIIRDLADQGEITKAANYTRFIDEAVEGDARNLRRAWRSNVRRFLGRLRGLESGGRLNEENVVGLLRPSMIIASEAAVLARGDFMDQSLLSPMGPAAARRPEDLLRPEMGGRSEVRQSFASQIDLDAAAFTPRKPAQEIINEVLMPLLLETRIAPEWGIGLANAYLDTLALVFLNTAPIVRDFFGELEKSSQQKSLQPRVHQLLKVRIERAGDNRDPVLARQMLDVIPAEIYAKPEWGVQEMFRQAVDQITRLPHKASTESFALNRGTLQVELGSDYVFGKDVFLILKGAQQDFIYFPKRQEIKALSDGHSLAIYRFEESKDRLYSTPSPVLFIERQGGKIGLRKTGFWVQIEQRSVSEKDLRSSVPAERLRIAEQIYKTGLSSGSAVDIVKRSEVRSAEAPVSAVGFFPGLGSRDAYRNLGSELYDSGIPEVQEIYRRAADALDYKTADGQPDPQRLFIVDANLPESSTERSDFIGTAFVVHNLALDAYLKDISKERGIPVEMKAYTGESFGILTASIAAGAISIEDGIRFAKEFTPCLFSCAGDQVTQNYHVIGIRGKKVGVILDDLRDEFGEDFEAHKFFAEGPNAQVNVYVADSVVSRFMEYMTRHYPRFKVEELKLPTKFIAHSQKMRMARQQLDAFMDKNGINVEAPHTPIIANNGRRVLRTATEVAQAILSIADEPMYSHDTVQMADSMGAKLIVEIGLGGKTRTLMESNFVRTPFIEFSGPASFETFGLPIRLMEIIRENLETLKRADKDKELEPYYYEVLRQVFRLSHHNPFLKTFLFEFISQYAVQDLAPSEKAAPPVFRQYMSLLQNTYLMQHVLDLNFRSDTLVRSILFKKRLLGAASDKQKIDLELSVIEADGRTNRLTMPQYKYPETIALVFGHLEASDEEVVSKIRQLAENTPAFSHDLERAALNLGYTDAEDFLTASSRAVGTIQHSMVYQLGMLHALGTYRAAILGQNFYYTTGVGPLGVLTALAAAEAISLKDAVDFYRSIHSEGIEKSRERLSEISAKNPKISVIDPATGKIIKKARGVGLLLEDLLSRTSGQMIQVDSSDAIQINFPSWVLDFGAADIRLKESIVADSHHIEISDLDELMMPNSLPILDMLERLSILRLTDQEGKVFQFASGQGTTSANVYPYLHADEDLVGFGSGGSESLTMIYTKNGDPTLRVRKVLSELLVTAFWDRTGQGVMAPPVVKAKRQANYLSSLPPDAAEFFPKVLSIEEREIPISPNHPDFEKFRGVYREFIYDMSYIRGTEVSGLIRKYQLPPAVVAHLYSEIFNVLEEKVHAHRRRIPRAETLETSYFKKIEDRLLLSRKTAPKVFNSKLLDTETIVLDGKTYRNARQLLKIFREHPEYQKVLEPRIHTLVMGDTNTENIKIENPEPILRAAQTGRIDFTAEEIGIRFIDPRSIGFHENGQDTGADDPMYDNKPWHNSMGHYDLLHGEYFDLDVDLDGPAANIDTHFHSENPYAASYDGLENYFKPVMTAALGLDDPESNFLRNDPYWVIRFAFIMGTHFTAMPPFHFATDEAGFLTDDYENQKRPVAIYAEGIKWLNLALDMLEGKVTEFHGFEVPKLPYQRSEVRSDLGLKPDAVLSQAETGQPVYIAEVIDAAGLGQKLKSENVFLIPPVAGEKGRLIAELNQAIAQWVQQRNHSKPSSVPFTEGELQELIQVLVREHRSSFELLAREFDDEENFPGNASIGLGGRLGQPTIFLNGWKKGKPSRTHDHGESKAAYYVLRGKLKETTYVPAPDGGFSRSEQVLQEGSTLSMAPPYIHQVENGNEDDSRTLSINAYAPLLVLMNRYDLSDDKLFLTDQWVDDEVVHEVLTSHTEDGDLIVGIQHEAIKDWQQDEQTYPGYTRNALAMTLLFTLLEDQGVLKTDLIKKGYSLENLNVLYRSGLDAESIFRRIRNASRSTLAEENQAAPISFEAAAVPVLAGFDEMDTLMIDAFLELQRPGAFHRLDAADGPLHPAMLAVAHAVVEMGVEPFSRVALTRLDRKLQTFPEARSAEKRLGPQLLKAWLANVNRFGEGLEKMQAGGTLPESNVLERVESLAAEAAGLEPQADDRSSADQPAEAIGRSEVRTGLSPEVTVIGFFPGFGSRRAYTNLGSVLYDIGVPEVQAVYSQAAALLGYTRDDGTPDPAKLFITDANLEQSPEGKQAFISLSFFVHNMALAAYFQHQTKTQGSSILFKAFTGESFGILSAAVAAGAMSFKDALAFAKTFWPLLLTVSNEDIKEDHHVISISGKDLNEVLTGLRSEFSGDVEIHRVVSQKEGTDEVHVYVPESLIPRFSSEMTGFPGATYRELKNPIRLVVHSKKMARARVLLEKFMDDQGLSFEAPRVPVISNNGSGILTTAEGIKNAILAMTDEPMFSEQSVKIARDMNPALMVEFGLGQKTRELIQANRITLPFFEFMGSEQEDQQGLNFIAQFASGKEQSLGRFEHLTKESRVLLTPWSRLVRGIGLGQYTMAFDPEVARHLRSAADLLDQTVSPSNHYNGFTNQLTRFVLELADPQSTTFAGDREKTLQGLFADLEKIEEPYLYVAAVTNLFESMAKMGMDITLLIQSTGLIPKTLDKLRNVKSDEGPKGAYERLQMYGNFFVALGQLGMQGVLIENENYVREALDLIDKIPSYFYRGRAGSMLIAILASIGYERYIFEGRDYLKELMDYLDANIQFENSGFNDVYPLFTTLNAIAVLGRLEYLTYKRDWLASAEKAFSYLGADNRSSMGVYYMLALYNLGRLQQYFPDLDRHFSELIPEYIKKSGDPLSNNLDDAYFVDGFWFFGREKQLPPQILERMVGDIHDYKKGEVYRNAMFGVSYVLSAFGKLGISNLLFEPNPKFDGVSPFDWMLTRNSSEGLEAEKGTLPYLNRSLLDFALRMRGTERKEPSLFEHIQFSDKRSEVRAGPERLSKETQVFFSPWSQLVRGVALGQMPKDFDAAMAKNITLVFDAADQHSAGEPFHSFSRKLTELILAVNNPKVPLSSEERQTKIGAVIEAIEAIEDPFKYVDSNAIFFDALAKLNLDAAVLADTDLVGKSLAKLDAIKIEEVKGPYERLQLSASLFLAIGQIGQKDRLAQDRDYIQASLDMIEKIPGIYYRGRAASVLFSVMKIMGFEDRIFSEGKNYLTGLLDYFDEELRKDPELKKSKGGNSYYSFPLNTILHTIGMLGKSEYLTYKRDWLKEIEMLMAALKADSKPDQGQYYLMALQSLGKLSERVPDLKTYIQKLIVDYVSSTDKGEDLQLEYAYLLDIASQFGHQDLVSDSLVEDMVSNFPEYVRGGHQPKKVYGSSYLLGGYALTSLDKVGQAARLFAPDPAHEGRSPLLWAVENFGANVSAHAESLLYLDHALIDSALRMRGSAARETPLWENLSLPNEARSEVRKIASPSQQTKPDNISTVRLAEPVANALKPAASAERSKPRLDPETARQLATIVSQGVQRSLIAAVKQNIQARVIPASNESVVDVPMAPERVAQIRRHQEQLFKLLWTLSPRGRRLSVALMISSKDHESFLNQFVRAIRAVPDLQVEVIASPELLGDLRLAGDDLESIIRERPVRGAVFKQGHMATAGENLEVPLATDPLAKVATGALAEMFRALLIDFTGIDENDPLMRDHIEFVLAAALLKMAELASRQEYQELTDTEAKAEYLRNQLEKEEAFAGMFRADSKDGTLSLIGAVVLDYVSQQAIEISA